MEYPWPASPRPVVLVLLVLDDPTLHTLMHPEFAFSLAIGLALLLLAAETLVRARPPRNEPLVG